VEKYDIYPKTVHFIPEFVFLRFICYNTLEKSQSGPEGGQERAGRLFAAA